VPLVPAHGATSCVLDMVGPCVASVALGVRPVLEGDVSWWMWDLTGLESKSVSARVEIMHHFS